MPARDPAFESSVKSSLLSLVQAGQFAEATRLLNRTHIPPEPDGWTGAICEELGDRFYAGDKAAAEWCYRESLRRFEAFAACATDSADAMARNLPLGQVHEKLQWLLSGSPWPFKTEIPGEKVLREFEKWAEGCCLMYFSHSQLVNQDWATQAAIIVSFLEDRHTPREMVYAAARIALRLYGSHLDPTGILASWLRVALPRLAAANAFAPDFLDTCRIAGRSSEPASPEIAALVKDYLGAADQAGRKRRQK